MYKWRSDGKARSLLHVSPLGPKSRAHGEETILRGLRALREALISHSEPGRRMALYHPKWTLNLPCTATLDPPSVLQMTFLPYTDVATKGDTFNPTPGLLSFAIMEDVDHDGQAVAWERLTACSAG